MTSIFEEISSEFLDWDLKKKPEDQTQFFNEYFGSKEDINESSNDRTKFWRSIKFIETGKIKLYVTVPRNPVDWEAAWVNTYKKLTNGQEPRQINLQDDKQSLSISISVYLNEAYREDFTELMKSHIVEINGIKRHTEKRVLPFGCVFKRDKDYQSVDFDKWIATSDEDNDIKGSVAKFACWLIRCMGVRN